MANRGSRFLAESEGGDPLTSAYDQALLATPPPNDFTALPGPFPNWKPMGLVGQDHFRSVPVFHQSGIQGDVDFQMQPMPKKYHPFTT